MSLLVFLFFVLMSGLDFVVHRVLYGYGLMFDYDWAVFYWSIYASVFFAFGVIVGFVYWLGSNRSFVDVKVSFGLFLTVCLLFLGGLADVLWFAIWGGGLPGDDVVWWWTLWYRFLGFWNSFAQLALLFGVFVVVVLFWFSVLR
ncbi:MAG: hypothetical protein QW688_05325 [Thermoprotei archaeon]